MAADNPGRRAIGPASACSCRLSGWMAILRTCIGVRRLFRRAPIECMKAFYSISASSSSFSIRKVRRQGRQRGKRCQDFGSSCLMQWMKLSK